MNQGREVLTDSELEGFSENKDLGAMVGCTSEDRYPRLSSHLFLSAFEKRRVKYLWGGGGEYSIVQHWLPPLERLKKVMKMVRGIEQGCDMRLQRLELFSLERTILQGGDLVESVQNYKT